MKLSRRLTLLLDDADKFLASSTTRIVLSVFILVSVLPEAAQEAFFEPSTLARLNLFFLAVFCGELIVRLALFVRSVRRREARRADVLLLFLDLLAVISFLPLESTIGSPSLRLLRLFRLLLLVGYWGRQARELLGIVTGPERRYQLVAVIFLAGMVSFVGALLVDQVVPAYDFNTDGEVDARDHGFLRVLWWSFRQVQDTGNLVAEVDRPSVVALSLVLTLVGVFLFSVIVGIGTGAIEELLERVREQPVDLRGHTVILGLTPYSVFLLDELAKIYRKNFGSFRGAILGQATKPPAFLHRPMLRGVQYRSGSSVDVGDLDRVDVGRAKRVLILGTEAEDPDGGVIASILAVREHNPDVDIFPDVEHERNFPAMRSAGGQGTHLVGSGSFLGYYIAQNVVYPGIYRIHRHLLTSSGCEVYTYVFSEAERRRLTDSDGAGLDPWSLQRLAFHEGVSLIGLFVARDPAAEIQDEDLTVLLNPIAGMDDPRWSWLFPDGRLAWSAVRGLVGVSLRLKDISRLAEDLVTGRRVQADVTSTVEVSPNVALRTAPAPERLLICGDSVRVPRVVLELFRCLERLDVTVAAVDRARCRRMARQVEERLAEVWGAPPLIDRRGDTIELRQAEGAGRVIFLIADWDDDRRLRQEGAVHLESADAVVLLPGPPPGSGIEANLDGRVALDCLHMADRICGPEHGRPGMHVLGYVRDPIKGDLLERRFSRLTGDPDEPRFTIVSSQRARHHFIMQNVFVRGLNSVYLELMSLTGQHLVRLRPFGTDGQPPRGIFDPAQIAEALLAEDRQVLLGYEIETPDGDRHLELDPRQMQEGPEIAWESVRAIYVLGSSALA